MIAEYERRHMVPGSLGRWCEHCQDYKIFAQLQRIGGYADTVQYVPRCITCGGILTASEPDSGF
jgi:hypothetical protein